MSNQNYFKTQDRVFQYDPAFPLRVKLELPQTVTVRHQHEFCECIFATQGSGQHQSEGHASVPIRRGDVLVIPVGGHHAYTKASDDLHIINLMFDTSHLPPVLMELYSRPTYKQIFLRDYRSFGEQDYPMTRLEETVFNELETMLNYLARTGDTAGNHCYKLGLFMAVLSRLCEVWKIRSEESAIPLDIPRLTAYLEQNFQQKIYLDNLAKRSGMSRATLLRHFHAALGVTPMIYLRNLRLRHAAELLLKTELNLKEIADQSGFSCMPYFFKSFKECYGVSPLEYRGSKRSC
ncbi:MAG: helix-turn-helix domain-containing protein [Lentisphaeria bacterium]|nr:helix-turn-helix domain-containing protein [Lentisphaeria bacterium]